jgi:diguanylate cyclase (GGDEF)-like protein
MDYPSTMTIGVAALLLFFLGLGIGRILASFSLEGRLSRVREEMRSHETEFNQLARNAERLRVEKMGFKNFLVQMSEFAREINTDINRPKLARLLLRIVDQMFQPRQILIFYTEGEDRLVLEESKGYSNASGQRLSIRMGEGRVGWVAEHQNTMERDDFNNQSRVGQAFYDNDPAGLRLDVLAPMVHVGSAALHNASQFQEVRSSAHHDGLTRLLNKKFFMEQLGYAINQAEINHTPLAVFLFDIDHFKFYNDNNGHLAGDEVLKAFGQILRDNTQKGFHLGRYGGEEFVIAMPNVGEEAGLAAAEKIRLAVEQYYFHNQDKQPGGNLTISGGIAVFPVHGRSSTDLINHADKALYRAKSDGRNRIEVLEPAFLGADQEEFFYGRR